MSLDLLAEEVVRLSATGQTTPVLVTPTYLSFRPLFYHQLVVAVAKLTDRPVRVDWLRTGSGVSSLIANAFAKREAARITRRLQRETGGKHSIELSSSIGRPVDGRAGRSPIVLGLCRQGESLPSWATTIPLSESR